MATAFTHGMVGLVAGRILFRQPMPARFWMLAAGCSALPDVDVGLHFYGVGYADLWGHRGMMHSLLFAAVLGMFITSFFFRPKKIAGMLGEMLSDWRQLKVRLGEARDFFGYMGKREDREVVS